MNRPLLEEYNTNIFIIYADLDSTLRSNFVYESLLQINLANNN